MRKIEYAVGAARLFIHHLHRDSFDRGMIASFGNGFRVEQGFTSYEPELHTSLQRVQRSVTNEGTWLYDSIEDVIKEFWRFGRKNRPWLLTVITDGYDNTSSRYRNNPAAIGRYVATKFNHEPTNFIFVIGVGEGRQIDKNALATLGNYGNFLAITIEAFPLLEMVFLQIAVEVSTRIAGYSVNAGNLTWGEVARIREVTQVAFDYAFLIDRSGSMTEQG